MKKIIFLLIVLLALLLVCCFQNERTNRTNDLLLPKMHKIMKIARTHPKYGFSSSFDVKRYLDCTIEIYYSKHTCSNLRKHAHILSHHLPPGPILL